MITVNDLPGKAIDAALNAWPGAFLYPLNKTRLILPITETSTKENNNG